MLADNQSLNLVTDHTLDFPAARLLSIRQASMSRAVPVAVLPSWMSARGRPCQSRSVRASPWALPSARPWVLRVGSSPNHDSHPNPPGRRTPHSNSAHNPTRRTQNDYTTPQDLTAKHSDMRIPHDETTTFNVDFPAPASREVATKPARFVL